MRVNISYPSQNGGYLRISSTRVISDFMVMSLFTRKCSTPKLLPFSRFFLSPKLVSSITWNGRSSSGYFSSTPKPSITGILISRISKSGVFSSIDSIAFSPFAAVAISKPDRANFLLYRSRSRGSSSAMRIERPICENSRTLLYKVKCDTSIP